MLVCKECKGKNVQVVAWVDANTNEYKSDYLNEEEDRWCEDCQKHVDFIEEEEKGG